MPSSEPSSAAPTGAVSARRDRLIAKGWIQGVALVMLFGFTVMGLLAYRTYTNSMPQPAKVVTANGETLFTTEDITAGQKIFQARGLMEYGSILGHGGYLGQDFTAEYLRMEVDSVRDQLAADGVADPDTAARDMLRTNKYDSRTGVLTWTDAAEGLATGDWRHVGVRRPRGRGPAGGRAGGPSCASSWAWPAASWGRGLGPGGLPA